MIKLYEKQSNLRECEATVVECTRKDNEVYIKLDQSIFFPEEGGQYADTGVLEYTVPTHSATLDEAENKTTSGEAVNNKKIVKLLDGQIVDGDIIYQVSEEIKCETKVLCKLNWSIRYDRMQNHSGEHILSGLINRKYGFNNIGFHLSDDSMVTLVMDGVLTKEQVMELEQEVNSIIYANLPITDSYPTKEELKDISYRSKIEIDGQVRLITIGDESRTVDICACCAPHVARTGEIGILKVTGVMKMKGGVQISILCGRRALEYINHNLDILGQIASSFTTHADNVTGIIENLKNENIELKSQLSEYREKGIIENIISNPDNRCIFTSDQLSAQNMKNIFNVLTDKCAGYVGIFVGTDEDGYRYYAGGNGLDARELAKIMREGLGAKGGGSEDMIQGKTDSSKEAIEQFWNSI